MSTDLTRTLADMARPLSTPPIAPPSLARTKAREIIDANPGTTLDEIVALAWLEGRFHGTREAHEAEMAALMRHPMMAGIKREMEFHDTADTCQRCGRKHRGGGCRCNEERQA